MIFGGWIKLHRKILLSDLYTDVPAKCLYIHLLLTAAFGSFTEPDGFKVYIGECHTSIRRLAKETGLSVSQVRTALGKLETAQVITQTATHKSTLIRLENWEFEQNFVEPPAQSFTQSFAQSFAQSNKNK